MGKKFIFNPETLSFEPKKFSIKDALKSIIPHLFITLIFGSILGYTLFNNVQTPELKDLQGHNAQLMSNFQILSHQINNQNTRLTVLEDQDDNTYRSVIGLKPIPKATRMLGYGGNANNLSLSLFSNSQIINELSTKSVSINNRIKLEAESYNIILNMVKDRDKMLSSIPSICPLTKKDLKRIGSGFGYRMHPILHVVKMHTGVDLSADRGVPVYASGDGVILRADASSGGYGNCIRINHGYSYQTVYAHLNKMLVVPGQVIKRGQLIGLVGNTGRSTSPHLHYEVRINNKPVNPLNYFYNDMSDDEYEIMINSASTGQTAEPM
ncbi:MAG: M23 family metallopeptidase [Bacteroidales bacterium]|nr:M23 family metallopeptidase [Bacteroidales bacterium]